MKSPPPAGGESAPQAKPLDISRLRVVYLFSFWCTLTTEEYFAGFRGKSFPRVKALASQVVRAHSGDRLRRTSPEGAFPPHGRIAYRWKPGTDRTGGTRKRASLRRSERLGKRDLYGVRSSIHVASSFVEPRTPVIYGGECQNFHFLLQSRTEEASFPCRVATISAIIARAISSGDSAPIFSPIGP